MDPLTSAWTELHSKIALLIAAVAVAAAAGAADQPVVAVGVTIAVAVAAAVSLTLDTFGGLAVGFLTAAVLVAARRAAGLWTSEDFTSALIQTGAILTASVAAALVGTALRPEKSASSKGEEELEVAAAFGSLGLLDGSNGMLRLQEEVERAHRHGRPLTLAVLEVDDHVAELEPAIRTAARRAVARLLESRLADTDVPFALTHDRLVAILPETTATAALERIGAVLSGVADGRYATRAADTDLALADTATVTVGTASLTVSLTGASDLLDAAMTSLEHARVEGPPGPTR